MGAESFQKRERERKRQQRAAERRQRRENKPEVDEEAEPVDADALMEQFRVLSERHAAGEVDAETYENERTAIFEQLGLL